MESYYFSVSALEKNIKQLCKFSGGDLFLCLASFPKLKNIVEGSFAYLLAALLFITFSFDKKHSKLFSLKLNLLLTFRERYDMLELKQVSDILVKNKKICSRVASRAFDCLIVEKKEALRYLITIQNFECPVLSKVSSAP